MFKSFKNYVKLGIFVSLFIPLLVTRFTFYPFVFGKAIAFQVLVGILLVLWFVALARGEIKLKWTKLNLAVLIYFLVLSLSTVFSQDIIRSFWGTQERMQGLFSLLHFGFYFLVLSTTLEKKDFLWLFRVSLGVSAVASVWALISGGNRLSGSLGNPGFLAIYLLLNLFFAIYLFLKDKRFYWRLGYGAFFLLNFTAFFLTKTRGAWVGLLVGLLILLGGKIWSFRGRKRLVAILVLVIILLMFLAVFELQKDRFLEGSETRVVSWGISWDAFKENPVLGWGPDNYILGFAKHFDPRFTNLEHGLLWFDKAHNIFWEYLVTTGLLGFLAYLSILFVASKRSLFIASVLGAYFVANLFWIETTTSLLLFFVLIAFADKLVLKKS